MVTRARPAGGQAPESAPVAFYRLVANLIFDDLIRPGTLLPLTDELAAMWFMTPEAAVRACRSLERDGLLARCPDCGGQVTAPAIPCGLAAVPALVAASLPI